MQKKTKIHKKIPKSKKKPQIIGKKKKNHQKLPKSQKNT